MFLMHLCLIIFHFLLLQLSFKYVKISSLCAASCNQRSLASYIKRHAYSNAKTEDLWAALEEGSGEPVNRLMNSWTKQKGYPVVSVNVKDQKLEFEQVYLCLVNLAVVFSFQLSSY